MQLKIMKAPSEVISPEELVEMVTTKPGPWLLSPKLDGYHCVIKPDGIFSSSMSNDVFINEKLLEALRPVQEHAAELGYVLCGELYAMGGEFSALGALRSKDGELPPNLKFYVFDCLSVEDWEKPSEPFWDRAETARIVVDHCGADILALVPQFEAGRNVAALVPDWIENGMEGAVLHHGAAVYKHGRVTLNEGTLFKVKAFDWHDAVILGVEEGLRTPLKTAERKRGPDGKLKPLAKGSKVASGSFGRFKVKVVGGQFDGVITYVGRWKGWTQALADRIWANPEEWEGQWIRFESMRGAKDLPRIPKSVEFRDPK